jgi:hypothetical protein
MKRLITIITCCVIFGYIFIAVFQLSHGILKRRSFAVGIHKVENMLGLGVLFDRPHTLIGRSVTYRFYQRGEWQPKRQLMEPLFEKYKMFGDISALKHCRLDGSMTRDILYIENHYGIEKMKRSRQYSEFLEHLFYSHNQNVKPDSLEIFIYIKDYETGSLNLSLNFKDEP